VTRLCVNVDHVATLRQARGTDYPSPLEAARLAEDAGAAGITIHLRGDRRHIQDRDVAELRREVRGKLNLEMAATDEMIAVALEQRPDQVTLVPERPEEITTEGGLDLLAHGDRIREAAARLARASIAVSVFIDPETDQLEALIDGDFDVMGFEINTDAYTRLRGAELEAELAGITACAARGGEAGLEVYAGHGLHLDNVGPIAAIPEVEELNIGHFLVSHSIAVGMETAVRRMLAAMAGGGSS
jgi:pyridoxine 5-phosphate synthase